ncbi:MAG: hypothetical protein QM784_07230 [Polyangiaceae bacterium]
MGALGACTFALVTDVGATEIRQVDTATPRRQDASSAATTSSAFLGPGFVYVADASPAAACAPRAAAEQALLHQIMDAQSALDLDVQLAILFSTDPVGCDSLYYVPLKNDIQGIGYAHTDGVNRFDEIPEANLEGLAFLNDLPYWERYPDEFRTAFLHEVGHRWGARIEARHDGATIRLTGRQGGHWSYFLDSDGSPLEGNRFAPEAPTVTSTPALRLAYSPLDLYLMGALPPEAVGPIRLLVGDNAELRDCAGEPLNAASPPQTCGEQSLAGTWLELGIEDVVAAEGPRIPEASASPTSISVGVFVLDNTTGAWTEAACEHVKKSVSDRFADFELATGHRLVLDNGVQSEISCSALVERIQKRDLSVTGGCRQSFGTSRGRLAWGWMVLLLASIAIRKRSTARHVARRAHSIRNFFARFRESNAESLGSQEKRRVTTLELERPTCRGVQLQNLRPPCTGKRLRGS